uniref:CCHC-type domain-containing protein n=1 Tax=Caenorhabditis tropicalis TaxID=1561998 RepID=A0A1I7TBM1_9PELO
MGEDKSGKLLQQKLVDALSEISAQLAVQSQATREIMEENRRLQARLTEEPRALAGGTRAGSNARLVSELARRVPKFQFDLADSDAFRRWISRHELTFVEDGEALSERERVRLLLGCLEESTYHRFVDAHRDVDDLYEEKFTDVIAKLKKTFGSHRTLMVRRQECLAISRSTFSDPLEFSNSISHAVLDAKLADMTTDDWAVFLFLRGLDAKDDAETKLYLMQYYEAAERKGDSVKLADIHDEWMRFLQLKKQTKVVSSFPSKPPLNLDVNKVEKKPKRKFKKKTRDPEAPEADKSEKFVPTCFTCGAVGHFSRGCPDNKSKKNARKKTRGIKGLIVCRSPDLMQRLNQRQRRI